jgi:hypothetical protein
MMFAGKWMELEDIMLSESVRIRKTKAACFRLYMEDSHKG